MTMLSLDHFVTATAGLRRQRTAARAERFGRPIVGQAFDDVGMDRPEPDDPPAPPMAFHLLYRDAKAQVTGRCVTLRRVATEVNDIRLTGFCYLRSKLRTFMASRVVEATDLATGEVHEDGLTFFGAHPMLQGLTIDALERRTQESLAVQECRDEVIVLTFVGAADGLFDDDEIDAVVMHVFDRVPDELREQVVRQLIRNWVPDEWAFEGAMRRLCAGEGDARALMRSMRRVIDADGDFDLEEMAFAEEIERRLKDAGRI